MRCRKTRMAVRSGKRSRHGLTLLELILALALSVMILAAISMAIDLHLRALDGRRTHVEEAQLARAVLDLISKDLRSAVLDQPLDLSGAASLAGDALGGLGGGDGGDGGDAGSGDAGAGGDGSGGGGSGPAESGLAGGESGGESGNELTESSNTEDIVSAVPPSTPGLFGNQYQLQVDISRLPRVDQYQRLTQTTNSLSVTDIPSDVKTVAYYMLGGTTGAIGGVTQVPQGAAVPGVPTAELPTTGLIRRELDRAVTQWAVDNGSVDFSANGELIAPEVTGIEFRYFDGLQWYTEWDSVQFKGLPVAVEVYLYIRPAYSRPQNASTAFSSSAVLGPLQGDQMLFRTVIRLPVAQPVSPEEESDLESLGL